MGICAIYKPLATVKGNSTSPDGLPYWMTAYFYENMVYVNNCYSQNSERQNRDHKQRCRKSRRRPNSDHQNNDYSLKLVVCPEQSLTILGSGLLA